MWALAHSDVFGLNYFFSLLGARSSKRLCKLAPFSEVLTSIKLHTYKV